MNISTDKILGLNPRNHWTIHFDDGSFVYVDDTLSVKAIIEQMLESGNLQSQVELKYIVDNVNDSISDETLQIIKDLVVAQADAYGSSDSINQFSYNGLKLWIAHETRTSLNLRLCAELESGKPDTTLHVGNIAITLPVQSAQTMLSKLEIYSSECYDVKETHKNNIQALTTVDELETYDFTTGYPNTLSFGEEILVHVQVKPTVESVVEKFKQLFRDKVEEQDDNAALENIELFPTWESMIGKEIKKDERYYYDKALWKVVQTHTAQNNWNPRVAASLFTQVVKGGADEGTLENPIPFSLNMELVEGLYYLDNGVVYLCIESLNQCFWPLATVPRYAQTVR